MFDSLDERIKRDDQNVSTPGQRWTFYGTVLLIALVVFAGMYASVRFLE